MRRGALRCCLPRIGRLEALSVAHGFLSVSPETGVGIAPSPQKTRRSRSVLCFLKSGDRSLVAQGPKLCNGCVQEICDDGIDNDGDGLADGEDPSCIVAE